MVASDSDRFSSLCLLVFQIEVPPDAYSVETALQILENQEYRLVDIKEVDQYRDVEMKGKVAIFESKTGDVLLLYAYRGEDAKQVWKAVKKKSGFLSVRSILELPNMGKFSTILDGKRIVSWWKKDGFSPWKVEMGLTSL